jgi:hypothetical protein
MKRPKNIPRCPNPDRQAMCGLLLKCTVLIALIHGFRALGRRLGPRYSGLILGLPSTTAVMLVLCGCERGPGAASRMAEASLLGLVAAVALPLAYAQAVQLGWRLAPALLGAVLGYVAVAGFLAAMPVPGVAVPVLGVGVGGQGVMPRLGLAMAAILIASAFGGRIADPPPGRRQWHPASSRPAALVFRSVIPTTYVLFVAVVQTVAGPSPAGLVSTFPSMSLGVLAVTHLEAGPRDASRIARYLPLGNLSTLAFLAAFCGVCPVIGLFRALALGYAAAVAMLLLVETGIRRIPRAHGAAVPVSERMARLRPSGAPWGFATHLGLQPTRLHAHYRLPARRSTRGRRHLTHRGGFSPWVETMGW